MSLSASLKFLLQLRSAGGATVPSQSVPMVLSWGQCCSAVPHGNHIPAVWALRFWEKQVRNFRREAAKDLTRVNPFLVYNDSTRRALGERTDFCNLKGWDRHLWGWVLRQYKSRSCGALTCLIAPCVAGWNGPLLLLLHCGSILCNRRILKIVLHSAWTPLRSYLWSHPVHREREERERESFLPLQIHVSASKCGGPQG